MKQKLTEKLQAMAPANEFNEILREATASVEDELKIEDQGWINLSGQTGVVIDDNARKYNIQLSRLYFTKDPLAKQSIRLWTDYTFGTGMTWSAEDEKTKKVLEGFWDAPANQSVLGSAGQCKSSNKALVDGDIFFAIFLGTESKIRRIDPLEITEFISDPEDKDNVLYYRRVWADAKGLPHTTDYRSAMNIKGDTGVDSNGAKVEMSEGTKDTVVYHMAFNTIDRRGNPLLLPALDWIKQYRRFLASRVAVMLALARFAWRSKVKGGSVAVDAIKAITNDKEIHAGSQLVENMGVDTTPIKTDSGASSAWQDGRMLKLQVCAAVGIPEQYFGDISTGSLATASTVELPMMKMFQSYQAIWHDIYKDINEVVLAYNKVDPKNWYVDMDFPKIAPEDVVQAADSIVKILGVMPDLGYAEDVKQLALMTMGVNDPAEVLDALVKIAKENPTESLSRSLTKDFKQLREALRKEGRI